VKDLGVLFCQDEHPATSGLFGQPSPRAVAKAKERTHVPVLDNDQLLIVPLPLSIGMTRFPVGRGGRVGNCCGGHCKESQLYGIGKFSQTSKPSK